MNIIPTQLISQTPALDPNGIHTVGPGEPIEGGFLINSLEGEL
jgi:hypothetical protein